MQQFLSCMPISLLLLLLLVLLLQHLIYPSIFSGNDKGERGLDFVRVFLPHMLVNFDL